MVVGRHSKNNVDTDIQLIKKDVILMSDIFKKFETTIEKLEELTTSMTKILSLHEQKLEYQEKKDAELDRLIETRRTELMSEVKELHSRITTVNRELTTQIESTEHKITEEIKSLKKYIEDENTKSEKILSQIQRWRWMILGGSAAVVWLISSVNFATLSKFFK
jgi:DNA repair exonuclease SbcCD ATPase subunit